MSDCGEVLKRLERYLDGECPKNLEAIVQAHLEQCPQCLDRADFERNLRALIASKCTDAAPSGLLDRIIAQLRNA
jgi:anti-sigma factor (TIGR02949 family)